MKLELALPMPHGLRLNFLEVATDSEIDFLTDALEAASHEEDRSEYGARLRFMNRLKIMLEATPAELEFEDGDPCIEFLAMAVEKLVIEQTECLADEGEDDSPEMDVRRDFEERIMVGKAMLAVLRPH